MGKSTVVAVVALILVTAFGVGYYVLPSNKTGQTEQNTPKITTSSKSLDLSGQKLTALSTTITNQTDVTSLNLSNNQLETLPANIGNMVNLEVLNVENNRLKTLPADIGKLTKLVTADFSNNRMVSLPLELAKLTQLKSLNLNGYKGPQSDIDQLKTQLPNTQIKM
ncbi:MAG: leucine-rich repeat domain-containing protein [Candidatus Saccharimonadales bacterium]